MKRIEIVNLKLSSSIKLGVKEGVDPDIWIDAFYNLWDAIWLELAEVYGFVEGGIGR